MPFPKDNISIGFTKEFKCCVIFNSESAFYYLFNKKYRSYCDCAEKVFIDGSFINLLLKIFHVKTKRNHGPELVKYFIENRIKNEKLVIVGGDRNSSDILTSNSFDEHIDLPIIKNYTDLYNLVLPHFKKFKSSKQKCIFFVSLGLPKQELFCFELNHYFKKNKNICIIPCGAALDFISGCKKRSPYLFRKYGFEWLPRLLREPRMFIRLLRSLIGSVILVILVSAGVL